MLLIVYRCGKQSNGCFKTLLQQETSESIFQYIIFLAIPINLLLCGCESWAVRVDHYVKKIEHFIQRQMRKILNINMLQVKEHITREQVRERFHHIMARLLVVTTPQFLLQERSLLYLVSLV